MATVFRAGPAVAGWLLPVMLLGACTRQAEPLIHEQLFAFGTLIEISLYDTDSALADKAITLARREFDRMHGDWHAWQPGQLSRLNERLADGRPMMVSAELLDLLRRAKDLSLRSDSLFNPAIGHLIRLWGFQQDDFGMTEPPDPAAIRTLMGVLPDMSALAVDDRRISSSNASLRLDLGAIAKGYGIDRVIQSMRGLGVTNAIVNAGGDLRAIGRHGSRPWRIGIRSPRKAGILAWIELSDDESVFTSGDYERFFEWQGKRYHHILDPRTGYPAGDVVSVTVIHADATTADAASTALFVAGRKRWHDIARQMGIRYAMLIDVEGVAHMNPAMAQRIHFEDDPGPPVRISEPL